ncbi:hypothetical protein [Aquisphaera insulae]|uniref:hypothetical protein n=1 Tax=Aquisphaera insulae TaxID=2712864 RepID=UPI0013E9FCE6|nr:hypothetical protein [Aquisphaera insulae]
MRPRRSAAPRLEPIEDRVVPSAVSFKLSPDTRAQIRSANRTLMRTADQVKDTLAGLVHQRTTPHGPNFFQSTHHASPQHKSEYFLGIPFIKI